VKAAPGPVFWGIARAQKNKEEKRGIQWSVSEKEASTTGRGGKDDFFRVGAVRALEKKKGGGELSQHSRNFAKKGKKVRYLGKEEKKRRGKDL